MAARHLAIKWAWVILPNSQSQDVQIASAGNNVYVSWWDRNATSNEPVLRASNDNGKTFGEKIMLTVNRWHETYFSWLDAKSILTDI